MNEALDMSSMKHKKFFHSSLTFFEGYSMLSTYSSSSLDIIIEVWQHLLNMVS